MRLHVVRHGLQVVSDAGDDTSINDRISPDHPSVDSSRVWEKFAPGLVRAYIESYRGPQGDAPAIGLSVPVVEVALKRQSYGIKPITEGVIADQQQIADSFFALGLLPKQIRISEAARRPGT